MKSKRLFLYAISLEGNVIPLGKDYKPISYIGLKEFLYRLLCQLDWKIRSLLNGI